MAAGDVSGEFIVTTADVLHEGVPGRDDPRGPVTLQSAHRPQPRFQPPVIGLDWIAGVPLDGVQGRGDQLVQDPRVGRGAVGGDLCRDGPGAQRAVEEPPGCGQVTARG